LTAAAALALGAAQALSAVTAVDGRVEFTYVSPYAASVSLAGDFNNWSMDAEPLEMDEDGVWRVVVDLGPGSYEYKFVVNGSEWVADPENPVIVGDYGNSGVTVDEDGQIAVSGGIDVVSNTAVNSRVRLTGWYRATYDTQSDVPRDPRWRLNRPNHEFYISVDPTVNDRVKGAATVRMATGSGDIKELHADIYSGRLSFEGGPFSVTGWYNEEAVQFDNPLEFLGHTDLAGTIPEEHIPFGRGAQGVNLWAEFWDFDLTGVYANQYDRDIRNDPSTYDNTDTDLRAVRLKRPVGPVDLGATYVAYADGWWIDWTGSNYSPDIEEYQAESGTSSDWFELSNTEQMIGLDAGMPLADDKLGLRAEYALYSYDGLFDMGNKEKVEGEDYSNGTIDVPFGDADAWAACGVVDIEALQPLDASIEVTKFSLDGMSYDEEYVAFDEPAWWSWAGQGSQFPGAATREYTEVRYDGSPLVATVFGPLPSYDTWKMELDAGLTFGIFDLGLEYDYSSFEGSFIDTLDWLMGDGDFEGTTGRIAGRVSADVLPEKLMVGLSFEAMNHDLTVSDSLAAGAGWTEPLDTFEVILDGRFEVWTDWSVVGDMRYITYRDVPGASASRDVDTVDDESFFAPYLALVYEPRPNVELRLSYGVDPTNYVDSPVGGRPDGRERWRREYLWDHGEYGVVDAEEALEDARTIGVMALIMF